MPGSRRAFVFEFPAAAKSLDAFDQDLEGYADMLVEDDIQQIKSMSSLAAARNQLTRARWASGVLIVLATAALVVTRVLI
jgi:hypothetical protein